MKFYILNYSEDYSKNSGQFGMVDGVDLKNEYDLKDETPFPIDMIQHAKFGFEFDNGSYGKNADFQMTYYPWRLISNTLYELLLKYITGDDITFYPIEVKYDTKILKYHLMHFDRKMDVINKKESEYTEKYLWNPVLNSQKMPFPNVFSYIGSIGQGFCISEIVKLEMEKSTITGCDFEEIPIV